MSASSSYETLKPCKCKKKKDLSSTEEGSQLAKGARIKSDAVPSVSEDTARSSSSSAEPSTVLLVEEMNPMDLPLLEVLVQAGGDPETGRETLIMQRQLLELRQKLNRLYRQEREMNNRRKEMRRLCRRMVRPVQVARKLWKVLDEHRGDKEELDILMAEWELCEEGVCELGKKLLDPKALPKK